MIENDTVREITEKEPDDFAPISVGEIHLLSKSMGVDETDEELTSFDPVQPNETEVTEEKEQPKKEKKKKKKEKYLLTKRKTKKTIGRKQRLQNAIAVFY